MKKFCILIFFALVVFQSCKKDGIGGTATQKVAGEWYVTVDAINADGSVFETDYFGLGHFLLSTFNRADNSADKMWITDNNNFWVFKGVVDVNVNAQTFGGATAINNEAAAGDPITFKIINGKVLNGMAKTPSGMPADSVVFEINFSDDTYPADNGFDRYRVSGYRYTGLVSDEAH